MNSREKRQVTDFLADAKSLLLEAERLIYTNQDYLGVRLTNKASNLCGELETFENRIAVKLEDKNEN